MIKDSKIQSPTSRFSEILRNGGELIASPDMFDRMIGVPLQAVARAGKTVRISEFLPKGTLIACDFSAVFLPSPEEKR